MKRARFPVVSALCILPVRIENIYDYEGHPGHELVRVCEARLSPPTLYNHDAWELPVGSGVTCPVLWKPLDDFGHQPLYPDGLLALLGPR